MPRTRGWTIASGAALLTAALGWSLVDGAWRTGAPQPVTNEALITLDADVLSETIAPGGAAIGPEGTRSADTGSRDAPPPTSVASPTEAEPTPAPGRELRAVLQAHDLASAKELLADAVRPRAAVDDLLDLVRHARDLVTQLMAVQVLASIQGEAASSALVRIGHDPSIAPRVRTQAVIGLGAQAADAARSSLSEFLAAKEQEVRLAAFRALGLLGDPDALHALERALRYEQDAGVRRIGLEALAQLDTPWAAESLFLFLEREDSGAGTDREAILWAIGTISGPEAVPELLGALGWAEDPALRAALIRGLATSADARAFDVLLDTVEKGEGGEASLEAINGLGLIGDPRALPALRELEAGGDESERRYTRTAIERIMRGGT